MLEVRGISRFGQYPFSVSGVETAHPAPSLYNIYQHLLPINHITKKQVLPSVPSSTKGRRAGRKGLAHPPTTLMKKLSDTSFQHCFMTHGQAVTAYGSITHDLTKHACK